MKQIQDEQKIKRMLKKRHFDEIFTDMNLPFFLVEFEKGEIINDQLNPGKYLLFSCSGAARIYNIHADGTVFEVAHGSVFTMMGDVEFAFENSTQYWIEVEKRMLCIGLPLEDCRERLWNDNLFLRYVMKSLGAKLDAIIAAAAKPKNLEERILYYMNEHDGKLYGVEKAASALSISRRHLQRILLKLCEDKTIVKTAKGKYERIL